MKKILIIVPCYNEQENIKIVITELASVAADYRIVVVNDGSTDDTSEVVRKNSKAIVLDLSVNLGIGGAVQTGFQYAKANNAKIVIKFDGDGQHNPADIEKIIKPIIDGKADIVIGSRFLEYSTGFQSTFTRRIGIYLLKKICYLLTGNTITDPTSGFRAYNKRAIDFMAEYYPSFDYPEPEEVILAHKNGLKIIEIASVMRERQAGKSSISPSISVYYMIKVILAMLFIGLRKPEDTRN